jgi:hypothetical protein
MQLGGAAPPAKHAVEDDLLEKLSCFDSYRCSGSVLFLLADYP